MHLFLSLLPLSLFMLDVSAQCSAITDPQTCLGTTGCVYLSWTTPPRCGDEGVCADNCAACDETECVSTGAGGNGACENSIECIGSLCANNCFNCDPANGNECADSFAPPNGCEVIDDGIEENCEPRLSSPSGEPSNNPSASPSNDPSASPSNNPSVSPSNDPSASPSNDPSVSPSNDPSVSPSNDPSASPSNDPSVSPSNDPSASPSNDPSVSPSNDPSASPSNDPSVSPTTGTPTAGPTRNPTTAPTTGSPTVSPVIGTTATGEPCCCSSASESEDSSSGRRRLMSSDSDSVDDPCASSDSSDGGSVTCICPGSESDDDDDDDVDTFFSSTLSLFFAGAVDKDIDRGFDAIMGDGTGGSDGKYEMLVSFTPSTYLNIWGMFFLFLGLNGLCYYVCYKKKKEEALDRVEDLEASHLEIVS